MLLFNKYTITLIFLYIILGRSVDKNETKILPFFFYLSLPVQSVKYTYGNHLQHALARSVHP